MTISASSFKSTYDRLIERLVRISPVVALCVSAPVGADIQHLDDVIIDGSACVGQDCVNGENFGFDTLRLKENNLRLHFDDTSNSASFPNNDWRIVINDSSNGGLNKFAIEDVTNGATPFTIEAGADANSLYIDDGGRVGFGTATPVVELHSADGDTPTLRLEQNGSSGFTPQTWDVAGNEAGFFVRDLTGGSQLPLRIISGADSRSLVIGANNNIGMSTSTISPAAALHIRRTGTTKTDILLETATNRWAVQNRAGVFEITQMDSGTKELVLTNDGVTTEMELRNTLGAGQVRLNLNNQVDGSEWVIQNRAGLLEFTKDGTGVKEMRIDGSGNLTVPGNFISGSTTLNVPDYVFDSSYSLMSLDDLERFIETEKHLPNVPSAAEIKEDGLNISQLQMQLLEKIEELTLYTLTQQKTISELQERIASLEQNN